MHKSRMPFILAALLGLFVFSAVVATVAQAEEAPFWSIGGSRLEAGKTHYITGKFYATTANPRGKLSAAGKVMSCSNGRLREGVLVGSNAGNPGTGGGIVELFENCTIEGNGTPCKPAEPLVSTRVRVELVESEKGEKGSLLAVFKPEHGVKFATQKFEGSGCQVKETALEGEVAVEVLTDPNNKELGEKVKLPNGHKEALSWLLNSPEVPIKEVWLIKEGVGSAVKIAELKTFSESASLTGAVLGTLAKKNSKGELELEEVNWSPLP